MSLKLIDYNFLIKLEIKFSKLGISYNNLYNVIIYFCYYCSWSLVDNDPMVPNSCCALCPIRRYIFKSLFAINILIVG